MTAQTYVGKKCGKCQTFVRFTRNHRCVSCTKSHSNYHYQENYKERERKKLERLSRIPNFVQDNLQVRD